MSSLSHQTGAALGIRFTGLRQAGGQHGLRHLTGTLADGREVFVKARTAAVPLHQLHPLLVHVCLFGGGYAAPLAEAARAALTA